MIALIRRIMAASAVWVCLTAAAPQRVMSLNICTDALVLELLPASRIASVTTLSRDAGNSPLWRKAAGLPVNRGTAEEVLAQKPDLVIAGTYTTATTRALLRRLGIPMIEVPPTQDFADIRAVTRQVAAAVGEREKGEQWLRAMDASLADLARTAPRPPIRVAAWAEDGSVPGAGSLFQAVLAAAGGVNVAASAPGFDLEQLLMMRPQLLAYGRNETNAPALHTGDADQPLVARLYPHRRITYPETLYSCGTPDLANAAKALRAKMQAALAAPRS